ncbi:MAG: 50S ribosomal protein L23 [Chitinivibrionales bacterium]|nr:50S ribosomal protein L23 [Chitinivibrionales bacterium]
MSMYHRIIKSPSITEKNTILRSEQNKYVFEVDTKANKIEIKEAVEKLFKVNVVKINTAIAKGKKKRMGRFVGKRTDRKKAIITLEEGQSIAQFGEV